MRATTRPSWDDTMFTIARAMAERSTCPRLHTAAVICTHDRRVVATGYNGSLPGQVHCDYVDVDRCIHCINGRVYKTIEYDGVSMGSAGEPCPSCNGSMYMKVGGCEIIDNHCVRTVHAELNAILQAAKWGMPLQGMSMFMLHRPCVLCAKAIVQAGIVEVVYAEPYRLDDLDSATTKLTEAGIYVRYAE